ncbi:hypothetical protein HZB88_02220 [archaeon]|nr:hypothetical protein [archaeon]
MKKKDQKPISKIEEEYNKLRKKYKLPPFEQFSSEFEIKQLKPERHGSFLKAILRIVLMKMEYLAKLIDAPLNPNPYSYHDIAECSCLTNEDKERITVQYKKICLWVHKGIAAEFEGEKAVAGFINSLWRELPSILKEERAIANRFMQIWQEQKDDKHKAA